MSTQPSEPPANEAKPAFELRGLMFVLVLSLILLTPFGLHTLLARTPEPVLTALGAATLGVTDTTREPGSALLGKGLEPAGVGQVRASFDGALVSITKGEVVCDANRILFTLESPSPQKIQMVLTSTGPFEPASGHVYTLGGDLAGLELTLLDKGETRIFTATEGNATLTAGRGLLRGTLYDSAGEQLLTSATWACP